jgi:hypothetical protein
MGVVSFGSFGRKGELYALPVAVDRDAFVHSAPEGARIARLSRPFGGGEAYSIVGELPEQFALTGAGLVRTSEPATLNQDYAVRVRAAVGGWAVDQEITLRAVDQPEPPEGCAFVTDDDGDPVFINGGADRVYASIAE